MPEWSKGEDLRSSMFACVGSNPTAVNNNNKKEKKRKRNVRVEENYCGVYYFFAFDFAFAFD